MKPNIVLNNTFILKKKRAPLVRSKQSDAHENSDKKRTDIESCVAQLFFYPNGVNISLEIRKKKNTLQNSK